MNSTKPIYSLHLGIAERGKLYAIEGNYKEALRHYREAIRMTQQQRDSEIFFQHYSQCVMEALELSGAHDEVINYCEKFIAFLDEKEDSELLAKYYAAILEKMAIQYLLKEDKREALQILKLAQSKTGKGKHLLTDELLNWVQRGFTISKKQIMDLQKKHNYFIVRKDKINTQIAIDLPQAITPF